MNKNICETIARLNSLNKTYQLCKIYKIGCSKRQIKRWADDGKINAFRDGHKYLISWQSLVDYIESPTIVSDSRFKTSRSKKQLSDLAGNAGSSVSRRNAQIDINKKKKK